MAIEDDISTERVDRIEDPVDVLADAELMLGQLGDRLHQMRQALARVRGRLVAAREGRPFSS